MPVLHVRRVARGAAVGLSAAALAFSTAIMPLGAAAAEPGQTVTLLGFNDFHGALDSADDFACTITTARKGADRSVLISSGDNVGGSAFVSAVANDEPTIDFLNALEVDVTAIGNHEFDQGQNDLKNRIETRTDFPDLAANVVKADGTLLSEAYTVLEVDGVKVAVVGAVTTKTVSKVSPVAIEGLEFLDPVDSVNKAIDDLNANGPDYDVLVVSYHEGASGSGEVGSPPANNDPIFDKIVNETSAEADAIFNGDSHRTYAWNASVPGQDGEVRPIIQTGASAANIGSVTLELGDDGDWDVVTGSTTLLPTEDADLAACAGDPVYDAATDVSDAAIAEAEVLGAVQVGSIEGDITTSWNDEKATYVDGVRVPLTEVGDQATTKGDDRSRHSAAGDMLADSMKWYLEDSGKAGEHPVIGWMNPGGIRAELWEEAAGAEGDGVVTYAEANNMLPFGNTLYTGEVTGAQFVQMLEEQWAHDGSGRFLAFSASANIEYVFDSTAPEDQRIIEVRIDGEPLDPDATYTIVAASFLFEGGDGMATLAGAANVQDSGVLDRDAFTDYLAAQGDLAPDYSQRQMDVQIVESGEYDSEAGIDTDPVLRFSHLESLSLGAPEITTVIVDAGEYGTFEAPYGAIEDAGILGADVTLTDWLCVPEGTVVPLTVTAIPETGTEIVFEIPSFTWTEGGAPDSCDTTTPPPSDGDDDQGDDDQGDDDQGQDGDDQGSDDQGNDDQGSDDQGSDDQADDDTSVIVDVEDTTGGDTTTPTQEASADGRTDLARTGTEAGVLAALAGTLALAGAGALGLRHRLTRR